MTSIVLGGCGGGAGSDATQGGAGKLTDDPTSTKSHKDAVTACNTTGPTDTTNGSDSSRVAVAFNDWQTCLRTANDAAVATIESALTAAGSSLAGTTTTVFASWRSDSQTLCDTLAAGVGDGEQIQHAGCGEASESWLASLIDTYAASGPDPWSIPADTSDFNACIQAATAAPEDTAAQAEDAEDGLTSCIAATFPADVATLATVTIANGNSSSPDMQSLQNHIASVIAAVSGDAQGSLCPLLVGTQGTDTGPNVFLATCESDAEALLGAELIASLPDAPTLPSVLVAGDPRSKN